MKRLKQSDIHSTLDILDEESVRRGRRGSPAVPSLEQIEWEYIQRVLHSCGGNISETARRLQIDVRTLQRKRRRKLEEQRTSG